MIDRGRHDVCGIGIAAVDYDHAVSSVIDAAEAGTPFSVSALAVHGVMTGVLDREHAHRLNALDLVVPDGQPVRWALNLLHRVGLRERVYGPELTLRVLAEAARLDIPIFFYGSAPEVLAHLDRRLRERFPALRIAGLQPSRFRRLTAEENAAMIADIKRSGARIVFVGLGCPRQEVWAFENAKDLSMPVLAVGAAFDFHAGLLSQAPAWMQDRGLEWVYRLAMEPGRLWRRYLYLNPLFCLRIARQYVLGGGAAIETGREPQRLHYG